MPVLLICLAMAHVGGEPPGNHVAGLVYNKFNTLSCTRLHAWKISQVQVCYMKHALCMHAVT